ncbi:MAG: hypothetical protein KF901_26660 [Myxococcales bacterium]|nr:hypothetical protein [Myxococcales bacterium]
MTDLVRRVGRLDHAGKLRPVVVVEHDTEHDVCVVIIGTSKDRSATPGAVVVDNPAWWAQLGLNGRTVYLALRRVAAEKIVLTAGNLCPPRLFLQLRTSARDRTPIDDV